MVLAIVAGLGLGCRGLLLFECTASLHLHYLLHFALLASRLLLCRLIVWVVLSLHLQWRQIRVLPVCRRPLQLNRPRSLVQPPHHLRSLVNYLWQLQGRLRRFSLQWLVAARSLLQQRLRIPNSRQLLWGLVLCDGTLGATTRLR